MRQELHHKGQIGESVYSTSLDNELSARRGEAKWIAKDTSGVVSEPDLTCTGYSFSLATAPVLFMPQIDLPLTGHCASARHQLIRTVTAGKADTARSMRRRVARRNYEVLLIPLT